MSTKLVADHLLVDMDGTLADSAPAIAEAWRLWSDKYAIAPPDLKAALGGSSADTVRQLVPADVVDEALERITEYELLTSRHVTATAGAQEFAQSLPPSRWSLVTSSRRQIALSRLRAIGIAPPKVLTTADDYKHGKPAPDPYLIAMNELPKNLGRVIAIEDSPQGVTSASTAGLEVLGVLTYSTRTELIQANWIVESLLDVNIIRARNDGPIELEIL
ncbi:HAD-IA family hydrolase [Mycobacterium sp. DSM 3803]|nr:HAD-IA family hydrolase [Mycobacterium sp. DSM 3803]